MVSITFNVRTQIMYHILYVNDILYRTQALPIFIYGESFQVKSGVPLSPTLGRHGTSGPSRLDVLPIFVRRRWLVYNFWSEIRVDRPRDSGKTEPSRVKFGPTSFYVSVGLLLTFVSLCSPDRTSIVNIPCQFKFLN